MSIEMTKNDINQISKLLDNKLAPIQNKLSQHDKILEQHGKALEQHGKALEQHGKALEQHGKILRSLKKDQNTMLGMLDGEQMHQRRRIKRIEEHLGFQPSV